MSFLRPIIIGMVIAGMAGATWAETNYVEAAKWFRKAAEQGDATAQFNLAACYHNGQGVPTNYVEAVKWFRLAAEQGDAKAQYNLAVYYDNGRGGATNHVEAAKWFRKAAEQGHAEAQFWLGRLYEKGRGIQKNEAEAIAWYNKAANSGYAKALAEMADRYFFGRGVPKDANKALALMTQAEEKETDAEMLKFFHNLRMLYDLQVSLTSNPQISMQQFRQAFPRSARIGPIVLGFLYFILGIPLIIRSYRYRGYPFNLWIILAWLVLFVEGQAFAFGLFVWMPGQCSPGLFLAVTVLINALPIIAAALGTLRGPLWGCAVSRATWKVLLCYALWGFSLALFGDWVYDQLWALLAQAPLPKQPTVPIILQAFRTAPALTFLAVAILAPVAEEIVFRGFIQDTLQKHLSPAVTILITAFLFSVVHMQVEYVVPLGIMGLILGWTRYRSGSLLVPVLMHILNNIYFTWLMWQGF
ncbi:MAG: SEL1-like repeat protein [Verrucomicrobia bacterium]|nr:SEL1-like repeat protein [Verrucomicrobiota bacterium]MBU4428489.1 SEL1-like repeat protein [Verrucomicrobiota bacterium]MCG2679374.1 CPBP family glutamic-type intramembrane protease [Kiritimatiellia bacterium]